MNYFVVRDGHEFGPYTLELLRTYVASGNIAPSATARPDGATALTPVGKLLGQLPGQLPRQSPGQSISAPTAITAAARFTLPSPAPPNLHWALLLLLGLVTPGLFLWVWGLVQASWMRKVAPRSRAFSFYLVGTVLAGVSLLASVLAGTSSPDAGSSLLASLLRLTAAILLLVARFSLMGSIERFFAPRLGFPYRLSRLATFFVGEIYLQYKFNKLHRYSARLNA